MFTGAWMESEIGSNFLLFALFGSGYAGLGKDVSAAVGLRHALK
jgi:hypothetical protein